MAVVRISETSKPVNVPLVMPVDLNSVIHVSVPAKDPCKSVNHPIITALLIRGSKASLGLRPIRIYWQVEFNILGGGFAWPRERLQPGGRQGFQIVNICYTSFTRLDICYTFYYEAPWSMI